MSGEHVWIVDDDRSIRWVLERALNQADIRTTSFENADAAIRRLRQDQPDAIISDIRMPGTDGLAMLKQVQGEYPDLPVIIMTAYADLDRAVAAFRAGAFEYLPKPFDIDDALALVKRAMRRGDETKLPEPVVPAAEVPLDSAVEEIVGSAPAMQEVFRAIGRLSRSHMTVLLTGESGTGKELVARALHRHSPRVDGEFIALNTAAIPRELLESELFGHERGAFTGATSQRIGRFEQADGGTLFLDEIGDMPAELQTRLLRVLADGEFYRVGGHEAVKVNVRVIAATHQDLESRVQAGDFREDLFHRLNVIRLRIPALRERVSDISALVSHFLTSAASELDVEPKQLHPDTEAVFSSYSWPGNVRQLENVCRWITVMAPASQVQVDDLPPELMQDDTATSSGEGWEAGLRRWAIEALNRGETPLLDKALPQFEKIMIEAALQRTGGRRQDAAKLLGWGRNTLTRKINELGMDL